MKIGILCEGGMTDEPVLRLVLGNLFPEIDFVIKGVSKRIIFEAADIELKTAIPAGHVQRYFMGSQETIFRKRLNKFELSKATKIFAVFPLLAGHQDWNRACYIAHEPKTIPATAQNRARQAAQRLSAQAPERRCPLKVHPVLFRAGG